MKSQHDYLYDALRVISERRKEAEDKAIKEAKERLKGKELFPESNRLAKEMIEKSNLSLPPVK